MLAAGVRCQRIKELPCLFKSSFSTIPVFTPTPSCAVASNYWEFWLMWRFKRGGEAWLLQVVLVWQHLLVNAHLYSLRALGAMEWLEGGESWSLTNLASFPRGSWDQMKRTALSVSICLVSSLCLCPSLCCSFSVCFSCILVYGSVLTSKYLRGHKTDLEAQILRLNGDSLAHDNQSFWKPKSPEREFKLGSSCLTLPSVFKIKFDTISVSSSLLPDAGWLSLLLKWNK